MEIKAKLKPRFHHILALCLALAVSGIQNAASAEPGNTGIVAAFGGGSEEPDLVRAVLDTARGKDSKVAIINAASSEPAKSGPIYLKFFQSLGVSSVNLVPLLTHEQAYDPAVLSAIANADLIYFTGGNQIRLAQVLADTPAHGAIVAAWQRGAVIAGTSAGAMVWGPKYLAAGTSAGALLKGVNQNGGLDLKPGLGLLPDVVIDTHFSREARLGRLLVASAQLPGLTGVGVDERTVALISTEGVRVIGEGHVAVVSLDGAKFPAHGGTGFSVRNAGLHLLSAGDQMRWRRDEAERRPMLQARSREQMALGGLWLQSPDTPPAWAMTGAGNKGLDAGQLFGRQPDEVLLLCGDGAQATAKAWQEGLQASGRTTVRILPANQVNITQLQRYLPIAGGLILVDDNNASLARVLSGEPGRLVRQSANHLALVAAGGAVPLPGETAVRPQLATGEVFPGLRLAPGLLPTIDLWTPGALDRLVVDALLSGGSLGIGLGAGNAVRVGAGSVRVSGDGPVFLLETDQVSFANPAGPSARDLLVHVLTPGEEFSY